MIVIKIKLGVWENLLVNKLPFKKTRVTYVGKVAT